MDAARRRTGRVALVLLAMVVAFGVGAWIAARSDPFAPQVEGGTPDAPLVDPEVDAGRRWAGVMVSRSSQAFREGTCETDWRTVFDLVVDPGGAVRGAAKASLAGGPRCYFNSAQPQTKRFVFDVRGLVDRTAMRIRLLDAQAEPSAGFDHGGFFITVAATEPQFDLEVGHGVRASGAADLVEVLDGNRSLSRNKIRLSCRSCE